MPKNKQIKHRGFTLLELLLVIGMVAILAGIVILAINPGRSLAKTRDLQRTVGISEINKALSQYYIDHGSYPPSLGYNIKSICVTGASATSSGLNCGPDTVDLSVLVPAYLAAIPVDPTGVGYQAGISSSHHVMLIANLTEVSPVAIAIGTTTVPVANDTSSVITAGSGAIDDPYQISNWSQLNHVRDNLDQNYILMNNLSSATLGYSGLGDNWLPIGTATTSFLGNFNGNNFTISDLIINRSTEDFVGLFGAIVYNSASLSVTNIYNLTLLNINIIGHEYVGGLVGYNEDGHISNCSSQGTVSGAYEVGGLVGRNFQGIISSSFSSVNIIGRNYSEVSTFLGGLVGNNYGNQGSPSNILNSYSTGSVIAYNTFKNAIGGFSNNQNTYSVISNSYSIGSVSGSLTVGGFLGYNAGTVNNSYWNKQTSGQESSAGGTGTTTLAMKKAVTYSGWDTGIWNISDGSYPTL